MRIKILYASLIIIIFLALAADSFAQEFLVEKVSGKVEVLTGTEENYRTVTVDMQLSGNDLLVTDVNSFIQLKKGVERFVLSSNSALGLNYIKKVSINDLLLALAMEEIRNVPKLKNNNTGNTAVYGEEQRTSAQQIDYHSNLGFKKLNGARQLAQSGFKESAIILAKEIYRKYPATKERTEVRIYFADLLNELGLYQEAMSEFENIKLESISESHLKILNGRIETLSLKISEQ